MGKYYYNKDFFQNIDTEEKAYWLGFLYADGCINRMYRNEKLKAMDLEIGLCRNDEEHLKKFLKSIESNVEIKHKKSNLNGKTYECSRIIICCTKMCYDLIDKGCTPEKSLSLKFPNENIIHKKLIKHFIRGYFDGDGCVSVNKNNIIQINFVGTSDMLTGISDFLLSENIIYKASSFYKKGNAYELFIYGADTIDRFYKKIYDGSTIFLDRKNNKFTNFFENNQYRRKSSSGKQGVYYVKNINKWIATICIDGKRKRLGSFIDKQEAIKIRQDFEILKYAD